MSICLPTLILGLQATRRHIIGDIPAASELHEPENYNGDFSETTAFERCAGLPRSDPLALCTLDEGRVSTLRLPVSHFPLVSVDGGNVFRIKRSAWTTLRLHVYIDWKKALARRPTRRR